MARQHAGQEPAAAQGAPRAEEDAGEDRHVEGADPAVDEREVVEREQADRQDAEPDGLAGRPDDEEQGAEGDHAGEQARQPPAQAVVAEDGHRERHQHLAERRVLHVRVQPERRAGVVVAGRHRRAQDDPGGVDVVRLVEDQAAARDREPRPRGRRTPR